MTTITIRNVDAELRERLHARAERNGRSMETELRHILNATLAADAARELDLGDAIHRRSASFGGVTIGRNCPVPSPQTRSFE